MAKYEVLTPIERDFKLYVPKGMKAAHFAPVLDVEGKTTGYTASSGGNGAQVSVDASGVIELTPLQAAPLHAAGSIAAAEPEAESKEKVKK